MRGLSCCIGLVSRVDVESVINNRVGLGVSGSFELIEQTLEVGLGALVNDVHRRVLDGVNRVQVGLESVALLRLIFFRRLLSGSRIVEVARKLLGHGFSFSLYVGRAG